MKFKKKFIEDNFFRPRWYSIFFNPYFIFRYNLYKKIKEFSRNIKNDSKILDVGCGIKPYKDLFLSSEYLGIDIEGGGHPDVDKMVDKYFDGVKIPYGDNFFDTVICTEVLEHSTDPEELISEMNRVLKKDGKLYITMPFVWNEHEIPYDFRRFTSYEHKRLLRAKDFIIENISSTSGVFGTCGQLITAYIFESIKIRSTLLKFVLSIFIFMPVQFIAIALDKLTRNHWITLGYVVIAKKKI